MHAAWITSSLNYFCLEFGDGRKNEKADPSDPKNREDRYIFDSQIAAPIFLRRLNGCWSTA